MILPSWKPSCVWKNKAEMVMYLKLVWIKKGSVIHPLEKGLYWGMPMSYRCRSLNSPKPNALVQTAFRLRRQNISRILCSSLWPWLVTVVISGLLWDPWLWVFCSSGKPNNKVVSKSSFEPWILDLGSSSCGCSFHMCDFTTTSHSEKLPRSFCLCGLYVTIFTLLKVPTNFGALTH